MEWRRKLPMANTRPEIIMPSTNVLDELMIEVRHSSMLLIDVV